MSTQEVFRTCYHQHFGYFNWKRKKTKKRWPTSHYAAPFTYSSTAAAVLLHCAPHHTGEKRKKRHLSKQLSYVQQKREGENNVAATSKILFLSLNRGAAKLNMHRRGKKVTRILQKFGPNWRCPEITSDYKHIFHFTVPQCTDSYLWQRIEVIIFTHVLLILSLHFDIWIRLLHSRGALL